MRYSLIILFLASCIFYGWSNFYFIVILLSSIIINYIIAVYLNNENYNNKRCILILGILFNISLLSYYKYDNFFINNFNQLFHIKFTLMNIVLPIGISFFTFTQIAYLVDSYRGLVKKTDLLSYALFVTYFPHLIAGPIIHHREIIKQFESKYIYKFNYRNFLIGMTLFSIGLFKKNILAENLVEFVNPLFDMPSQIISFVDSWIGVLSYTLELYFDFSGYSDMALGLSLLFGIKLPINFYSPYKSKNIIEFWRRWNMSLSRFLRNYLYIPLGGNKYGKNRRYINLMITMLLGGLWHGANWTFVIWGGLHGIYLCINHGFKELKKYFNIFQESGLLLNVLSQVITFIAVVIAWVFFRSPELKVAFKIIHSMFSIPRLININQKAIALISFSLIIIFVFPNSYQLLCRHKVGIELNNISITKEAVLWQPTLLWNIYIAALFVLGAISIATSNTFLYFRF